MSIAILRVPNEAVLPDFRQLAGTDLAIVIRRLISSELPPVFVIALAYLGSLIFTNSYSLLFDEKSNPGKFQL